MELGPKLGQKLVEGQFVERTNRFLARVIVAGREVGVHVPNSGRMLELFTPGARVLLRPVKGNHRKTCYDLALVDLDGTLVSADARLPNALVAEAITGGRIPPLSGYSELIREAGFGESRLDIMLNGAQGRCRSQVGNLDRKRRGAVSRLPYRSRGPNTCNLWRRPSSTATARLWCSWSNVRTRRPFPPTTRPTRCWRTPSGTRAPPAWRPTPTPARSPNSLCAWTGPCPLFHTPVSGFDTRPRYSAITADITSHPSHPSSMILLNRG